MKTVKTVLIVIISILTFASCKNEKRFRIGVSQCSQDDWRNKMNDEIYREIMFHPEAEVEIRSADDSNEKQIADIKYFQENDFDIIIVAPNEADAITPIIKDVYESGTPVIVFDRNINGDTFTAFQGADNPSIGRSAAHYAAHLMGDTARVLEIYGLPGSTPAIGRHEGFIEGAHKENINILATAYGNWNYDDAALAADSLLRAFPEANMIYAHNDRMAIAASDVARKLGRDIKIIGIDAAPEIGIKAVADGTIDATFLYPTEGYKLIRTALAILKGEPFNKITTLPVASAVDKSNADILLMQNESLKEETQKIKVLKGQVDDFWSRHSAQTTLFYAAIAILLLLLGLLFVVLRAFWQRQQHQKQLMEQNRLLEEQRDTQRSLNEQLNAATQSKLSFFTNVSHDLRTPLTLISEPIEQIADASNLTPQQATMMSLANKNVKILKRLINQILDFRKFENGKLSANIRETTFAQLAAEWVESFRTVARKRDINLTARIDLPQNFSLAIDVEKIERVVFNLLSNAFKYTRNNGNISFCANLSDDGATLRFSVSDTGIGIPENDIENIFNRFFQVEKVHPEGSGIGLSLVKAFVELHNGSIKVESLEGKGSTFTVEIPVVHTSDAPEAPAPLANSEKITPELTEIDAPSHSLSDDCDKPLVLIIDDNNDIRLLLSQLLADKYTTIIASNGHDGVHLAAKYVPDLIICDVMMPGMDGFECCSRIKNEISTSHIPVLMLTACSLDEQRAHGYESGADGYLSKPFSKQVLISRCKSLIENRKRINSSTVSNVHANIAKSEAAAKPSVGNTEANVHSPVNDIDNEFYNRFLDIVSQRMGDPDLSVDALAAEMSLGRSQFYRKIKALTNYTPVELLRTIRLRQARTLLTTTDRTIAEIAYQVGFSTPAYFTRCYREMFGETPSELRDKLSASK